MRAASTTNVLTLSHAEEVSVSPPPHRAEAEGGRTMRSTHIGVVLTFLGWLSSGGRSAPAQDTPLALLHPPSEHTATATPPGVAPTPQFLRVTIGLEVGGPTLRIPADPAWLALHRPHVRARQAPTQRAPAVDVAPPLPGGGDALYQAQALARAQPSTGASP